MGRPENAPDESIREIAERSAYRATDTARATHVAQSRKSKVQSQKQVGKSSRAAQKCNVCITGDGLEVIRRS